MQGIIKFTCIQLPLAVLLVLVYYQYYCNNHNNYNDSSTCRVEQGLSPHGDVEGDIKVRLVAAGVKLHISGKYQMSNIENRYFR